MRKTRLFSIFLGSMMSIVANAVVIDFEDIAIGTANNFNSKGYSLFLSGTSAQVNQAANYCNPLCPENGTHYGLAPFGQIGDAPAGYLNLSKSDGGLFNLLSFDAAGTFNFSDSGDNPNDIFPTNVYALARKANGEFAYQEFAIDKQPTAAGTLPFTHNILNNSFTDLTSVLFASYGSKFDFSNGFSIDNIEVNSSVPEPQLIALFMIGLFLLGAKRSVIHRAQTA